ncbi:uncharacterized protein LOC129605428 [Condylostylus longicornis]|uniref:uncharacterized protein LOC129605428 n=1 Tax=Condylostylus longicornis TaxID=2530218 RepID=UPI00244E52BA|nr:uncharacterized protein LOC129605428 [Condylostylus longicornis]
MWNLELGFPEDETIHDGFCTNTLLKLCVEKPIKKLPEVHAVTENKTIALSIDKSVFILENEDVTSNPKSITFDSKVEALGITMNGDVIVCALDNGHIHGIFSRGYPVFDLTIEENENGQNCKVIAINRDSENSFRVFLSNGSIYYLSNIDESQLYSSKIAGITIEDNLTFEEVLLENVKLEKIPNIFGLNEISYCYFLSFEEDITSLDNTYIYISGNLDFIKFQNNRFTTKILPPKEYGGIKNIFSFHSYIVALTVSGQIFEICPYTRTLFANFTDSLNYSIEDIVVIEANNESIELLLLCKSKDTEEKSIKVVKFPSFEILNEISLTSLAWLVLQPKESVNLYYLSSENLNDQQLPLEIEMKVVKETQPEERLKKLIQKGHLEEAEDFGKKFDLSLQPVYKAKIRKYIHSISLFTENDLHSIDTVFSNLISTLKLIEDKKFFHEICMIEIPSRQCLEKYLEIMLLFLDEENYFEDLLLIKEQLLRLKTLDIIDPYECNRDWQKFVHHPNIIKVCASFFSVDMCMACIIWKRHSTSIIPYLDENAIRNILNLLPSTIEAFSIIQWLRCFIPGVIQNFPKSMRHIVEWSIKKTRSLQFCNYWPAIGLEFSTKLLDIFENVNFLHSDIRRQYDACIENLKNITNILEDLLVLKNTYNLVFALDDYEKNSMDQTTLKILERVQTTMLSSLVKDFLYPIYREMGKTPINSLIKHIEFLVSSRNGFTAWIERAVILINLLHNEEQKLSSALLVLRSTPVPWPESVQPLLEFRNSSHALAIEINTLCEMQIVEAMKIKYGWETNITDSNIKLLSRIVYMDLPDMFEDIKNLTAADPSLELLANFYCCFELGRKGKIERAGEFLNSLNLSERQFCCEKLINIIMDILEDSDTTDIDEENEYLLKLIKSTIGFINEDAKQLIKTIENVILLKKNFCIKIQVSNLYKESFKKTALQQGILYLSKMINEKIQIDDTNNLMNSIWHSVNELSNALELDKIYGLLSMAKAVGNIHFSCALAYNVIEFIDCTSSNFELFVEFAILIVSQQLLFDQEQLNDIEDPLAYPIAFELLKKAANYIKLFEIEKLSKWIRIGSDLYGVNAIQNVYSINNGINNILLSHFNRDQNVKNVKQSKKRDSFSIFDIPTNKACAQAAKTTSDPTSVLRCLSLALVLVILQCEKEGNDVFKRFDQYLPDNLTESLEKFLEKFYISFEHLVKSKQHEYWYKIAQFLMDYQKNFRVKIITPVFLSLHMRKIFRDALAQKNPNFPNLFGMLICDHDPKSFLNNLFNELKSEHQKMNYFCLSERYFSLIDDTEKVVQQRQSRLKYFYFAELRKQGPDQVKNRDIDTILFDELKYELLSKILNINLLEKFCDDFDLNYQSVLISQVINLLRNQELLFDIKLDQFGKEELVVKTFANDIRDLCQPYIDKIENKKDLGGFLLNYIPKINSYFYEMYLCVFEILLSLKILSVEDTKRFKLFCSILTFLKHKTVTRRKGRPTDVETESWLKNQTDKTTLSNVAKYRLPFSFFFDEMNLDTIMRNDIDIDNCEGWFPLVKFYSELSQKTVNKQDHIIISTIKRAITKYCRDYDTWQLTPVNNAFLQSVLRLLQHISDKSMILAILYNLTNNAPDGADQVEAAFECYKFAIQNEQELLKASRPHANDELISKIKRKYPFYKMQHLLHIYGLVEDKLIQLIESPKDLIVALYHHESLLKNRKPNINQLAAEIAELMNINLLKLQHSILERWLSCSNDADVHEMEETFYEDLNGNDTFINTEGFTAEFVTRSHYILSSWTPKSAISFLLLNVFPSDGSMNAGKQLQAVECFCRLIDGTVVDEEYLKIVNQQQFMIIKCVYYLKQLGFNFTIDKFEKYDKLSLLKKIWQNYSDKPLAMEIIANICIGFNIHEPKIWNSVLKQMVNFHMLKELDALVEVLSCKAQLLYTDGLKIVWEYILKAPFKHANRSRSFQQDELLSKNLFRIQGCPLIDELNLIEIAEDCIRLDRPHLAAILMGLCKKEQKETIKKLVKNHSNNKLKEDVIELQECGILQSIINNVLKELEL